MVVVVVLLLLPQEVAPNTEGPSGGQSVSQAFGQSGSLAVSQTANLSVNQSVPPRMVVMVVVLLLPKGVAPNTQGPARSQSVSQSVSQSGNLVGCQFLYGSQ